MTSSGRRAVVSMTAILIGVTLLGRVASAAEPTTLECLTAYEDSVPLKNNHQLRATRGKLVICSSESCPAEVRAECSRRVLEVDASMPTVVFEAKDVTGMEVVEILVKMDGDVLADRLLGSALPVDPGEHTFTFAAAGRPTVEKRLLILEGEKLRRERVELQAIAAPRAAPAAPLTIAKPAAMEPNSPPPGARPSLGRARTLALVLGGVGVAAIGVGALYGSIAMSRKAEAQAACPGQCADQDGVNKWDGAFSAGNISTGAFVVGAAAIASGAFVWWRARPAANGVPETQVSLGPGGLRVLGRW
jgi:hypothetical protein